MSFAERMTRRVDDLARAIHTKAHYGPAATAAAVREGTAEVLAAMMAECPDWPIARLFAGRMVEAALRLIVTRLEHNVAGQDPPAARPHRPALRIVRNGEPQG